MRHIGTVRPEDDEIGGWKVGIRIIIQFGMPRSCSAPPPLLPALLSTSFVIMAEGGEQMWFEVWLQGARGTNPPTNRYLGNRLDLITLLSYLLYHLTITRAVSPSSRQIHGLSHDPAITVRGD